MDIQIGKFYRHFKGNVYQVLNIATHSETSEKLVIYQALYGTFEVYARPYDSFTELLDKEQYPESHQKYRFEEISKDDVAGIYSKSLKSQIEERYGKNKSVSVEQNTVSHMSNAYKEAIEAGVSPILLSFLEADTSEEKLEVIRANYMDIDERTLTNIEASLDIFGNEGSLDDRIHYVCDNLRTKSKYENMRLR